ncbi:MAG: sensor histidine kinase [Chitinophagaceae bacterium]
MTNQIKKIANWISYAGIQPSNTDWEKKQIIFSNRIAFVCFLIMFKSQITYFKIPSLFIIPTINSLVYLSVIFFNSFKKYQIAKAILCYFPAITLVFIGGFQTQGLSIAPSIFFYAVVLIPVVLYGIVELKKTIISVSIIILLYAYYEPITNIIPRDAILMSDNVLENYTIRLVNGIITLLAIIAFFLLNEKMNFTNIQMLQLKLKQQKTSVDDGLNKINELQKQHKLNVQKIEELENLNKQFSAQALRAQIDPHFMFNALNSIQNFILNNDSHAAIKYVSKFGKLMRQTLEGSQKEKVCIDEELDMLKNYLQLEQLRFDNMFDYEIDIDEQLDVTNTEIPSMLLQPFVENAILHGLRHKKEKGFLKIVLLYQFEHILCIIEDNGIGRNASEKINAVRQQHVSTGTNVTKSRLALLQQKIGISNVIYIDLNNEEGTCVGTRVEITIPTEF